MTTPTQDGQASVNGLLMGRDTSYKLLSFNPWTKNVRAEQQAERAWNHGSWSGPEWAEAAVVPMRVLPRGVDAASWLGLHQQLIAAFRPSHVDVELRFMVGGTEYLMRGRPRMVEPAAVMIGTGQVFTQCAFLALDPRIYSAAEHTGSIGLPSSTGGLTIAVTVPFTVPAVVTAGRATLTNAGTEATGLLLRVDGPVASPRVTLTGPDGPQALIFNLTLTTGQWLDVDTAARTVYINGTSSRRGLTAVVGDWPLLPPGPWELAFDAAAFDAAAQLSWTFRDAWM
ncbi:MAG: phage distal tail protein [Acidimicrobiales bacterium]